MNKILALILIATGTACGQTWSCMNDWQHGLKCDKDGHQQTLLFAQWVDCCGHIEEMGTYTSPVEPAHTEVPQTVPPTVTEVPMTYTVETCPKGYRLERWYEPTRPVPIYEINLFPEFGYYPVDPPAPPVADPHPDRCVKEAKHD